MHWTTRPGARALAAFSGSAGRGVLGLLAAAVGCGNASPPALTVGPVSFSQDELLGLSEARRSTLAHLAAFGLAVADSTTADLGAPLVDRWADDRLLDILAAELTLEKNEVGDAVLEAHYLTNPEWELTVRHILFFSERWRPTEHREQARAKARRALAELRDGADFASTAARLSEEPGAEGREGLLTPGREGSWVPEFWAAAVALDPGETSPVTETQYGYHILRLEDRQVVPFAEARSTIARDIAERIEDPGAVLQDWLDAEGVEGTEARRAAALSAAERRGFAVRPAEREEIGRRWADQVYQWSATLGFQQGLTSEEVAEAALAALANPAQNADIARRELAAHEALLTARYDITMASPGA